MFVDDDYTAGCQSDPTNKYSRLVAVANFPMCVPKKCVGEDWIAALIEFSSSKNPMLAADDFSISITKVA